MTVKLPKELRNSAEVHFLFDDLAVHGDSVYAYDGLIKDLRGSALKIVAEFEWDSDHGFDSTTQEWYVSDGTTAYLFSSKAAKRRVATKSPANLRHLVHGFATDGVNVYLSGVLLKKANPANFKAIRPCFSKDDKRCYFWSVVIESADPATFQVLGKTMEHISFDKNNVYRGSDTIRRFSPQGLAGIYTEPHGFMGLQNDFETINSKEIWDRARVEVFKRALVQPKRTQLFTLPDEAFTGLEYRLALFLFLCEAGSVEGVEKFTRGRIGEAAILRAIEKIEVSLNVKIANVDAKEIEITPLGKGLFHRYGAGVRAPMDFVKDPEAFFAKYSDLDLSS